MSTASNLFMTVGALVSTVFLGALLAHRVSIDSKSIAALLIYLISPLAIFSAIDSVPFQGYYLLFTGFFYLMACILATLAYCIGRRIWPHSIEANLLAFSAGTGNTGYFGLSLAISLLSPQAVAIVAFSTFGLALYEFTYGYYLVARQHATARESILKLLKLPLIYTFSFALLTKYLDITTPLSIATLLINFKATYSILGMLLIGISLTGSSKLIFDWRLLGSMFLFKFLAWPLVIIILIYAKLLPPSWLTTDTVNALLLLAIVPLAGNCVAVATQLGAKPEKVASAVVLSVLIAVVTVPGLLLSIS